MGRLERFLRLERARPDRKDGSGSGSLDRFRDPPRVEPGAEEERRLAAEQAEERRREAEALAERELEKLRSESAARRQPVLPPVPGTPHPPFDFHGASPLLWALRGLQVIEDPWYRFAARLAVIGTFIGLVVWSLSSPARYPFFLLAVLLLGGGGFRRRRWGRWDRWDRWG